MPQQLTLRRQSCFSELSTMRDDVAERQRSRAAA